MCRQRCSNGRAHAAAANHQSACAFQRQALAHDPAHKAFAVKHVALQLPVRAQAHGIAGAGDSRCGQHLVHQRYRADLVGHGDQRATDIAQSED